MAYHDGYHIRSDDTVPRSGSVAYEGGLIFGTSGRFSGVLGVGADPRDGQSRPVTWVFGEPRIRIYEWPRERRVVDLEVAGRIGQGNSGPRSVDPSELAAGLVVACHLDHAPGSRGLRAVLEILHGRFGNVGDFTGNQFTSLSVNLSWLP